MSSLRQDPLTGRWVIIAAKRQGRPNDFRRPGRAEEDLCLRAAPQADCPFCPGQEHQTPPEVMATGRHQGGEANSPGWQVRVFPNKFPAMQAQPMLLDDPDQTADPLLRPQGDAIGGHEVLVCCPGHQESLASLTVDHLAQVLFGVRERVRILGQEHTNARYVLVFGNHGPEAGATLAHSHLQIITTPVVPILVVDQMANFIRHDEVAGSCLLCDTLESEESAKVRLVSCNPGWVAVAPWASRFAYEMKLIPRRHAASMLEATDSELHHLADLLKVCLNRLLGCSPNVDFNLVFHNAPVASTAGSGYGNEKLDALMDASGPARELFHWHLEILPRLSRLAGFETGTGFAINSLPPEEAAARLRPEGI